jgi:allantoinase
MILDQFETMLELSERAPLVCGVSLHTFVAGQPFRLAQIERALRELLATPDFAARVWVTTPGAIARYAADLPAGTIV